MEEQPAERVLSAGRRAVDADARDVVVRILRRDRLVPEDAIREAGVAEVLPRDVVERLRSVRRPHAVDLDDDEAELGDATASRCRRANDFGTNEPCGPA